VPSQQNREGARAAPRSRRPNSFDRRLHRPPDLRRRRVALPQAQERKGASWLAQASYRRGRRGLRGGCQANWEHRRRRIHDPGSPGPAGRSHQALHR
jgi:hypothetical protein